MVLKTPSLASEYSIYKDVKEGKEVLVCTVGSTILYYDYRCIADLHEMLKKSDTWMELGSTDEKKATKELRLKHGPGRRITPSVVGMVSEKAFEGDLPCISLL